MHVRKGLIKNEVLFHKLIWALIPKPLRWSIKGRWRVIIAVNFQFEQLEGRSLENIRASTRFESVTSAIPVRCSTNWAMKSHIGSEVDLLSSCLPVQWNDVKYTYFKKRCRRERRIAVVERKLHGRKKLVSTFGMQKQWVLRVAQNWYCRANG